MSSPIVIVGASGHAAVVAQAAKSAGLNIIGHLADKPSTCSIGLLGTVNDLVSLLPKHKDLSVFVAIGDNHLRKNLVNQLRDLYPSIRFASIIHPSAIICEEGSIGRGAFVAAGAIVAVGAKVGDFAVLNTRASLDHHASLGAFASMAPASATGGNAHIGEGAHIGMGAMVHHGIKIGEHTILGSLALANKDIPANEVWVGNPARRVKQRQAGDRYL